MDHDMLLIICQANLAAQRAIRKGAIDEAERWSKVADRYATILLKVTRARGAAAQGLAR